MILFWQVATWSDIKGLTPIVFKLKPLNVALNYERNRTYIVTTIIETPYLSTQFSERSGKEEYIGFCKDLAEMLSHKLEITCKCSLYCR